MFRIEHVRVDVIFISTIAEIIREQHSVLLGPEDRCDAFIDWVGLRRWGFIFAEEGSMEVNNNALEWSWHVWSGQESCNLPKSIECRIGEFKLSLDFDSLKGHALDAVAVICDRMIVKVPESSLR